MRIMRASRQGQVGIYAKQSDRWMRLDVGNADDDLRSLIAGGELNDSSVARQLAATDAETFVLEDLVPLAPIPLPEKLICIGKNYADHATEFGGSVPDQPIVFSKFVSAIIGPGESIRLPAISDQVDFEAELVVVIGKPGRDIAASDALSHVFGYCCGNDISARDWQKGTPSRQWLLGKTFDTFAPLGPVVVTADEIDDPQNLNIQLRLNGDVMQHSNTGKMIFPIRTLIEHVSKFCTLVPGDLIYTGTPEGVGGARQPPVFLRDGDTVEVEIEELGVLANPVVAS